MSMKRTPSLALVSRCVPPPVHTTFFLRPHRPTHETLQTRSADFSKEAVDQLTYNMTSERCAEGLDSASKS